MTLRVSVTFGFALTVLSVPFLANAQGVVAGAQQAMSRGTQEWRTTTRSNKKSAKQTARTQNRLNSYFRNAVVTPALRECWSRLQGTGEVAFDITFRKSGSRWAFENISVIKSDLLFWQGETAARCLRDAISPTYFHVNSNDLSEEYAKKFVVRWTWPVPLPPKNAKLARMIGGGGLGETGGSCQICDWRGTYPYGLTCKSATSGYSDCQSDISSPNQCSYSTPCTSGKFGTVGGVIIMY